MRIRPFDASEDIDVALAIVIECELAGIGSSDATRESVTALLDGPDSLREASLLAFDAEWRPVGLLTAEIDTHGREIFLDAYSIGTDALTVQKELMVEGVRVAATVAGRDPAPGTDSDPFVPSPQVWQVMAGAYEQDEQYRQVLSEIGMRPIRRFWRMLLDLKGRSGDVPPAPPGVTLRVVDGEADRRLMHALFCESFAEHFGSSHDRPFDEWIATVEGLPGTDPSRWWIASKDGAPVGICLLDDSKAEFDEGYVRTLGVIPSARGLGIATWLLGCAAADCVARGRKGLALSVDGENVTGATELYASVGFEVRQVIDVWCYPIVEFRDSALSK